MSDDDDYRPEGVIKWIVFAWVLALVSFVVVTWMVFF